MRNGYSARFRGMLKLLVTTLLSNLIPAICPEALDYLTAAHEALYTLSTHYARWRPSVSGCK